MTRKGVKVRQDALDAVLVIVATVGRTGALDRAVTDLHPDATKAEIAATQMAAMLVIARHLHAALTPNATLEEANASFLNAVSVSAAYADGMDLDISAATTAAEA